MGWETAWVGVWGWRGHYRPYSSHGRIGEKRGFLRKGALNYKSAPFNIL